jgi:16S rRNA (uracil1498-N3)-methyltransferase
MTRRRWIADEVDGNTAALTGAHADHLTRVLRARLGEEFDVVAADTVRRARLSAIHDGRVEFELGDLVFEPAAPQVSLLLAIYKFDRMEWAIEKATELGVARIVPVIAQRSDRHLTAAAPKRLDRWQRIALQASEQARRTVPPVVLELQKLGDAARMLATTRIVLSENEQSTRLKDALTSHAPTGSVLLAVGPEGGWASDEETLFRDAGWISASLGTTILRAETASIAALAVVFSALN